MRIVQWMRELNLRMYGAVNRSNAIQLSVLVALMLLVSTVASTTISVRPRNQAGISIVFDGAPAVSSVARAATPIILSKIDPIKQSTVVASTEYVSRANPSATISPTDAPVRAETATPFVVVLAESSYPITPDIQLGPTQVVGTLTLESQHVASPVFEQPQPEVSLPPVIQIPEPVTLTPPPKDEPVISKDEPVIKDDPTDALISPLPTPTPAPSEPPPPGDIRGPRSP